MSIYARLTFYIWNGMEWKSCCWSQACLFYQLSRGGPHTYIIGHISVRSVKSRWFCQPKKLGVAETHQLHWKDVRNASGAVSSVSWTNLSHFLIRVRRGVPRTFYISGSFLIHKLIFWPDRKSFKILLFTWGLENAFIWLK